MSTIDLNDRIKGCVFGSAIGDALGLITENMKKPEISRTYETITFPAPTAIKGILPGDWTDETDSLVISMEALRECLIDGRLKNFEYAKFDDPEVKALRLKAEQSNKSYKPVNMLRPDKLFSYRLRQWVTDGFPALGDSVGKGCDGYIMQVVSRVHYSKNPVGVARNIWTKNNKPCTNSCLNRILILGALDPYPKVHKLIERFCVITHPDPRCVAASMVIGYISYTFMHMNIEVDKIETVIDHALRGARQSLANKKHKEQLDKYAYSSLENLKLDKDDISNFAFRAMGAAIWGLRKYARFSKSKNIIERIVLNIILEGGDADCNASIACSLIGAYVGYKQLPSHWIKKLKHKSWLTKHVDDFCKALEKSKGVDSDSDLDSDDESENDNKKYEYDSDLDNDIPDSESMSN